MDETEFVRTSKPFANMVICCTGASIMHEARAEIAKHVVEMGAGWREHLTKEVTHMLVGETNTKKYKYIARQRPDVKVVMASFVEAARDIWINGEDFSLEQLEEEHRLPTFFGLKICVTNLQEDDRNEVNQLADDNGGKFHGDLTKDVTHLIVGSTEGKKYKFARSWNIKCVTRAWLTESIERGMALEEEFYDPKLEPDQIGKGAWIRPMLGKRKPEIADTKLVEQPKSTTDIIRRKIRRTASDRLGGQSQNLWGDIVGQGQALQPPKRDEWEETSFNQEVSVDSINIHLPDESPHTLSEYRGQEQQEKVVPKNGIAIQGFRAGGLFDEIGFFVYGFEGRKANHLYELIQGLNGECYSSLASLMGSPLSNLIVVVPETLEAKNAPATSDLSRSVQVVTYWWIEKCMHNKKYVDPAEHILSKPFKSTHIQEFDNVTISISLFDGVDFLHVHKAIDLLGATWCEQLSPKRSLLLVDSSQKGNKSDKVEGAKAWNIPIVSIQWLYECIHEGKNIPLNTYLVEGSKPTSESMLAIPTDSKSSTTVVGNEHPNPVLQGCVVYVGTSLKEHETKFKRIITFLGGIVNGAIDDNTTHFLHLSTRKGTDPSDVKQARKIQSCKIISPNWIKKCYEERVHVDEVSFLLKHNKPVIIDPSKSIASNHLQLVKSDSDEIQYGNQSPSKTESQDFSAGPFLLDDDGGKHKTPTKPVNGIIMSTGEPLRAIPRYESPHKPKPLIKDIEPLIAKPRSFSIASATAQTRSPSLPRTRDLAPVVSEPLAITKALESIKALRAQAEKEEASGNRRIPGRGRIQGRALSNNSIMSTVKNVSLTTSLSAHFDDDDASDDMREKLNMNDDEFGMSFMPSQTLVYADETANMEKKKLYEALNLQHEDKKMLGRTMSVSTASVEEMGDPVPVLRRSKRTNV